MGEYFLFIRMLVSPWTMNLVMLPILEGAGPSRVHCVSTRRKSLCSNVFSGAFCGEFLVASYFLVRL